VLIEPFVGCIIIFIFYLGYVYWLAFRRKRVGSQYALGSTVIVFLVAIYQILVYALPIQENTFLSFIGFVLFFFIQSLILSYRFAYSLRKAKDAAESASKAKTDFLSTISHEIRTPLNAVVGISHFLINEDPKEEQIESLESLQFSAEHLTILINDILDYNKLESGSIEFDFSEVDLKKLSEKMIKTHSALAREKNLELILDYDKNIHDLILADSTRLYQVLNNLLNNALKFTHQGHVKLRLVKVTESESFQKIYFEVSDTGIGIPKEKQQLVFDRFTQAGSSTTREYGGTGLGLAIIRKILTLFDAEIKLESEEGRGTSFSFELEFKKIVKSVESQKKSDQSDDNRLSGKRVLLVEDNRMNIMVAEKFLKKWNLEVDIAMNGLEGVNCAKSHEYDLVLMDLQMPIMDGYTASKSIREFNPSIPIIALTASALLKVQQEVKAAGMNDFITKPFDPEELKKKLISFIN
jgi:signal transduction histidine kinase/CheY-like chemotaxis protein